jgi:hypothetical protein
MRLVARERTLVAMPSDSPQEGPPALALAEVVAREGDHFRIRCGVRERIARCHDSVDPAVVEEAISSGARVLVEWGSEPLIAGALATRKNVHLDRDGGLRLSVKEFEVTAEQALIRTPSAFVSVKSDEVEIFGRRILSRARELARILARAIQLD